MFNLPMMMSKRPINGLPSRSISLSSGSSQYLSMVDADWGTFDRSKWAVSLFLKRSSTGSQYIMHKGNGTANSAFEFDLRFSTDTLVFTCTNAGNTLEGRLITTATYTNTSIWYHFLATYDALNPTSGDRMRLWANGSEVTSFSTDTSPDEAIGAKSVPMVIGARGDGAAQYFDGLMHQVAFFSGSHPAVTDIRDSGTGLPKDIGSLPGLYALLDAAGDVVTHDAVRTAAWTNNGGATASATIPT